MALGKLPWGFASSAGGAVALRAWEAVVWGDKTYCVFVWRRRPTATWAGVAGFIKAVFRWNAPPTQSMEISGIEASAPHDPTLSTAIATYTGMMNAAAHWRAGNLSDKAFVAGELAFVTATTNNQSVHGRLLLLGAGQEQATPSCWQRAVAAARPPTPRRSTSRSTTATAPSSMIIDDAASRAMSCPPA